jgi:hypothetical protein
LAVETPSVPLFVLAVHTPEVFKHHASNARPATPMKHKHIERGRLPRTLKILM